jgi:hypothetical protein
LGVPLGTSSFTSSFIRDALLKDVQDVDLLLKMGDVQITFGIITHYFMQQSSYLKDPSFFESSLLQLFGSKIL